MSHKLKKPFLAILAAIVIVIPVTSGAAAFAAEPLAAKCVTINKQNQVHTYDTATGAVTLVVSGGEVGVAVCNPLFINLVAYAYTSANSPLPQEPVDQVRIYVDKVGTYSGAPQAIEDCRQYDAYASHDGWDAVTPPVLLNGPDLLDYLHQYSTGPRTYDASPTYGCEGKPEVPEPEVIQSDWTAGAFVCGDTTVTLSRTTTTTYYTVVFVDGEYKLVVDSAKGTVVTETDTRPLSPEEIESCRPDVSSPEMIVSEWVDGQYVCGDETVDQTRTVTTTYFNTVLVSGSTWKKVVDTDKSTVTTEHNVRQLTKDEAYACAVTASLPTPPQTLASTGVSTGPLFGASAFVLLVGTTLLMGASWRRRKAAALQ